MVTNTLNLPATRGIDVSYTPGGKSKNSRGS